MSELEIIIRVLATMRTQTYQKRLVLLGVEKSLEGTLTVEPDNESDVATLYDEFYRARNNFYLAYCRLNAILEELNAIPTKPE